MTSLSLFNLGPVPSYFDPSGCSVKAQDFKFGSENRKELINTIDNRVATIGSGANFDRDSAEYIIERINEHFETHDIIDLTKSEWWTSYLQRFYRYLNELLIVNEHVICTQEAREKLPFVIKKIKKIILYKRGKISKKQRPWKKWWWNNVYTDIINIKEGKETSDSIPCPEDCNPIENK